MLPSNEDVSLKLANIIFSELPDTIENNNKILSLIGKDSVEALILKGKILQRKEDYDAAIKMFDTALFMQVEDNDESPPKASCFFYLGNCYEKLKEFKPAIMNYKKCLTVDNNHLGATLYLANLLANMGEGQRAAKYFKHAIKIDPESINGHFGLAKAI